MNIGLVDVDGHNFSNFALMRIAGWHRHNGDDVSWAMPLMAGSYDRVYKSKIFTFTSDDCYDYGCEVVKGGTGYDIKSRLSEEVEGSVYMDYSIYPQFPYSIQFFSRGCIRHCPFCLVHDKEGWIHSVDPVDWNPNAKWVEVLDNNFFAASRWRDAVEELRKQAMPVKFHGVDLRIMDEEQAEALCSLKHKGNIHVAWDLPQVDLSKQLEDMTKHISARKITCYCLIGYKSSKIQDMYRLKVMKRLKVLPFVQPYRDFGNSRVPTQYERDLAAWANQFQLFFSCDFWDYSPRIGFKCSAYYTDEEIAIMKQM